MPSTEVYVLGQKYTIKGEASAAHVRELSGLINESIREVCAKYPTIPPMKALILTLFNMADELHQLKADQEHIARDMEEKAALLSSLFD